MRSTAASPVTASMRRTPAATLPSETIRNGPISPVARTCVPPHSSCENPGISTTRTTSPYFSPKSAMAPSSTAVLIRLDLGCHRDVARDLVVDDRGDVLQLVGSHPFERGEIEAQPVGRHQRPGLLRLFAEHRPQRAVQEMGRRVIAANRRPPFGVDLGPRRLARSHEPFGDDAAVNVDVRSWLEGIVDVDQPGVGADPAGVPDLAARLAVERRAVQDHLDRVTRFRLLDRSVRADEPEDPRVGSRSPRSRGTRSAPAPDRRRPRRASALGRGRRRRRHPG